MSSLVWFRGKDLRLHDHRPLYEAGPNAHYLFVLDPFFFEPKRAQQLPNRMAYLLESLRELQQAIAAIGGTLLTIEGRSVDVVPRVANALGVSEVVAQRWTEPFGRRRDEKVASRLDVPFRLLDGETLVTPGTIRTKTGTPYSVFTPFYRSLTSTFEPDASLPAPTSIRSNRSNRSVTNIVCSSIPTIAELGLDVSPQRLSGGEQSARKRLQTFISERIGQYHLGRDQMGTSGTSRLSQDLKFGTISARTVWNEVMGNTPDGPGREHFLRELVWREFSHHSLWDQPTLLASPFRPKWEHFPWAKSEEGWQRWVTGQTGYPIVDASARELLETGFVHNRARMISASFLTKHLGIDYKRGEAHYMRYLTGGDWAQNNAGWQWAAGCGCDAQPYFRVFNPMRQGERYDTNGAYVRKWIPEISGLSNKYIHQPWEAPPLILAAANITLGETYPLPIVDHATARKQYLAKAKSYLQQQA
jgi:deoxyribodipyrimidine photo-lyase